jgi:hypothetical protein
MTAIVCSVNLGAGPKLVLVLIAARVEIKRNARGVAAQVGAGDLIIVHVKPGGVRHRHLGRDRVGIFEFVMGVSDFAVDFAFQFLLGERPQIFDVVFSFLDGV